MKEQRTKEEWNAAGDEAEQRLRAMIAELLPEEEAAMANFFNFHRAEFMNAGHKRLGRLYVKLAKEMPVE